MRSQINSSGKIINVVGKLKFSKLIEYPSKEFYCIQPKLTSIEMICEPLEYDEGGFTPHITPAKVLVGRFLDEPVVFLVLTTTKEIWKQFPQDFFRSGGVPNREGYFITSVCGNNKKFTGLGIEILRHLTRYVAADYFYLWVDPNKKAVIKLYKRFGFVRVGIVVVDSEELIIMRRAGDSKKGKEKSEVAISKTFNRENLDSLNVYKNTLIVTAKSTDELLVFNKKTLELQRRIKRGFDRPNGIKVIGDYCFIVERDGHRVSVLNLPSFKRLFRFGETLLAKPYGIDAKVVRGNVFELYVTDNLPNGGGIVYLFRVVIGQRNRVFLLDRFGDKVLRSPESVLWVGGEMLFVSNEKEKKLELFSVGDKYIRWRTVDESFRYDPEGIAMFKDYAGRTFIIVVDQGKSPSENRFKVFRVYLESGTVVYRGFFFGKNTENTDGICIDRNILYAVDDDRRITKMVIGTEKNIFY
jgi:3-phytase